MNSCGCGGEENPPQVKYSPEETYHFRPPMRQRILENLGIAAATAVILTVALALAGEDAPVSGNWRMLIGAGVALVCFAMLTLSYFNGKAARFAEVSPKGITIEQRNGARMNLVWSSVRAYAYDGARHIFLVPGGRVVLRIPGLSHKQKALLRLAVRTPLEEGSMKWGRRSPSAPSRAGRTSLLVVLACGIVGGLLIHAGYRPFAGVVLGLAVVYCAGALLMSVRRRKRP